MKFVTDISEYIQNDDLKYYQQRNSLKTKQIQYVCHLYTIFI